MGKGLNNNVIASVKNGNFISEPETDFIFAVIGEELGFVGACVVIVLLILIALECISIARQAKDLSGNDNRVRDGGDYRFSEFYEYCCGNDDYA